MQTNIFMTLISETDLYNLKRSIPLAQLVQSDGVELKRVGANLVGICPFHLEKSGSLVITPSKNLFHCFGCGAAGSVIDWVMRMKELDFRESVKYLMGVFKYPPKKVYSKINNS